MGRPLHWVSDDNVALLTDLYELTMAYSYFRSGHNERAAFDLFVRNFPEHRSFLVSAGLEQILVYLENLRFFGDSIGYLRTLGLFDDDFLAYLSGFKFTGDVWAIPEGEIYFPNEPVVVVVAPIIEAQIVETFLLNTFNFQSLVASKAARVVIASEGIPVVDFSPRRDHGADAAVKAARASYIAGCIGTSNVLAGRLFSIPVFGTMAHSYVMSFESELESFRRFSLDFPESCVLLIDTYDVIEGAKNAIIVGKEMEARGKRLRGVRIDSGDLSSLSKKVRVMLDEAGLNYVKIMATGDLNEYRIADIVKSGAPVDSFGVGTEMGTSKDAPALGGVYKLCEYAGKPRMKFSLEKVTLPGRKKVVRVVGDDGSFVRDVILREGERVEGLGSFYPLLTKVMEAGRICCDLPSLPELRRRFLANLEKLPEDLKRIDGVGHYRVDISESFFELK
jgi:nicotinate phosphoribosyltransferase